MNGAAAMQTFEDSEKLDFHHNEIDDVRNEGQLKSVFGTNSGFHREHPLENFLFSKSSELIQIEAQRSEHHFYLDPESGSKPCVIGIEKILDHGVRTFSRRADPGDPSVSEYVTDPIG